LPDSPLAIASLRFERRNLTSRFRYSLDTCDRLVLLLRRTHHPFRAPAIRQLRPIIIKIKGTSMNTYSLLAAGVLAVVAISAQAGELFAPQQFQDSSTLTRAQVRQSVLAARRAGELDHNDIDLPGNGTSMSNQDAFGRTRASVRAETLAARSDGELDHNDVDLPSVAKGAVLTRRDVRNEAVASRQLVHTAPGRNTIEY